VQLGSGESCNVKRAVSEFPNLYVGRFYSYTTFLMKATTYPLEPTDSLCCAPFIVLDIVTLAGRAYTYLIPLYIYNLNPISIEHHEDPNHPRHHRFPYIRYFLVGCAN
jgi:hypothetical protein